MAFMFSPGCPCCPPPCLTDWPGPCEAAVCTETIGGRTCYKQVIPWSYAITINIPVPNCTDNMYMPADCSDIAGERTVIGNMCSGYFLSGCGAPTFGSSMSAFTEWQSCGDVTNPGDFCQELDGYTWPVGTFPSRTRFSFGLAIGCCSEMFGVNDFGLYYSGGFEFEIFDGTDWVFCDGCSGGFIVGTIPITPINCSETISYSDANISIVMQREDTAAEDFDPFQECTATWI